MIAVLMATGGGAAATAQPSTTPAAPTSSAPAALQQQQQQAPVPTDPCATTTAPTTTAAPSTSTPATPTSCAEVPSPAPAPQQAPVTQSEAPVVTDVPAPTPSGTTTPTTTSLTPSAEATAPTAVGKRIPYTGLPTENPNSTLIPGKMRSDREEWPEPFTKEEADQAEIGEARLLAKQRTSRAAATCQKYWPSNFDVCGAIRDKYNSLGGTFSFLLLPTSGNIVNPGNTGERVTFMNGPIYWSAAGGAHPVVNSFLNRWGILGYEGSYLKYPTTDEIVLPDGGRRQEFQDGAIYVAFQNAIGSAIQNGPLRDKYNSVGGLTPGSSPLGYLTGDHIRSLPDGQGQMARFQNGVIYYHPTHGAWPVRGDILSLWGHLGYEASKYGYPRSDAIDDGTGWFTQTFANGPLSGEMTPPIAGPEGAFYSFDSREAAIAWFDSQEALAGDPQARQSATASRIPPGSVQYGPCILIPQFLHWRTDSGPGAIVGYKPVTRCDEPMTSIKHETDLRYEYFGYWRIADSYSSNNYGVKNLQQKNVEFHCTGDTGTWFGGRTLGTINVGGKEYYAAVYPPRKKFDCEV
ncbi:LGFP repeat-containing protein [Rhodococcus sp. NBC_00294]|uniref:LGFP repeat-containing protein n=1 Tax=Rhodococcus sp. NBC_00294 TaxID=2976004 RepID=UPI002E29E74E|nr:hypothetical protein [Rhodococcus sp. NBC_00294]